MDNKVTVGLETKTTDAVRGVDAVSKEIVELLGNVGQLENRLRQLFTGKLPADMKKLEGYIAQLNTAAVVGNKLGDINKRASQLATGGPTTAMRNAALTGVVRTLQSDPVVQALKYEKELNKVLEARRTIFQRLREADPNASQARISTAYGRILKSVGINPDKTAIKAEVAQFQRDFDNEMLAARQLSLARYERQEADFMNREDARRRKHDKAQLERTQAAFALNERAEANFMNRKFDRDRKREQASSPEARMARNANQVIHHQERLGTYGGAPLLATQGRLIAGYAAFGGALAGVGFAASSTVQLQVALKNVQAIAKATDLEMKTLTKTIFDVGQATRFSTKDIAEAATTMAQAGYSANQIKESLPSIAELATGAGASMQESVNIVTSVLNIYDLSIERTAKISNQLAEALNGSKLSLDQLSLGVQYAGNIAKDGGVQFEEMTAALGAMANAGIKSGSTLGTGLRALIRELASPTDKFRKSLEDVGLTTDDVDVKSQGLGKALQNLSASGFDSAKAMETFELRAAAAFSAMANNLDTFEHMMLSLENTTAATEASATQMETLMAQFTRLGNAITELSTAAGGPFLIMLQNMVGGLATMISTIAQAGPAVSTLTTFLLTLMTIGTVAWLSKMAVGFVQMRAAQIAAGTASAGLITNLVTIGTTAGSAAAALKAMSLALLTNPVLLATTAITGLIMAFTGLEGAQAAAAAKVEKFRTEANEAAAEAQKYGDRISEINAYTEKLTNRYNMLSTSQGSLNTEVETAIGKFGNWGDQLTGNISTIDQLITRMGRLRTEMAAVRVDSLRAQDAALGQEQQALKDKNRLTFASMRGLAGSLASSEGALQTGGLLSALSKRDLTPDETRKLEAALRHNVDKLGSPFKGDAQRLLGRLSNPDLLRGRNLETERRYLQSEIGAANLQASEQANYIGVSARGAYIGMDQRFRDANAIKDPKERNVALAALRNETNEIVSPSLERLIDEKIDEAFADPQTTAGIRAKAISRVGPDATEPQINAQMRSIAREGLYQQNPDIGRVRLLGGDVSLSTSPEVLSARSKAISAEISTARQARDNSRVQQLLKEKSEIDQRVYALKHPDLDPREIEAIMGLQDDTSGSRGGKLGEDMTRQTARIDSTTLRRRAQALEKEIDALSASTDGLQGQGDLKAKLGDWKNTRIDQIKAEARGSALSDGELQERLDDFEIDAAEYFAKILDGNLVAARDLLAARAARSTEDSANLTGSRLAAGQGSLREALDGMRENVDEALAAEITAAEQQFKAQNPLANALTAPEMMEKREELTRKWSEFTFNNSLDFIEAVYQADIRAQERENSRRSLELGWRSARVSALSNAAGMRNLSDVQRVLGSKRQESIDRDGAQLNVDAAQGRYDSAVRARDSLQTIYNDEVTKNGPLTAEALDNLEAANVEVQEMADAWERARQAQEALVGEMPAFTSMADAIRGAWEAFAYNAELTKPIFEQIAQGFYDAFGVAQEGMKNLVKDVVTGTKTMGEAFKDFARSVLEALLDMVAKMIANKILMWIMSTVLGTSSDNIVLAQGGSSAANGMMVPGIRRNYANGGQIFGATPNRDSVPINTMPGEMIMNRSAVEMIGADKLMAMNAMGNRRLGEIKTMAPPAPREPDMVNVYVMAPNEKPQLGKKDILAVISEDISTGGITKKLVKSVAIGAL